MTASSTDSHTRPPMPLAHARPRTDGMTSHGDDLAVLDQDTSMPIAVIGMGFRGPADATSVEGLWKMVLDGREGWSAIPPRRWNHAAFYHPDHARHGTINVQGGHFMTEDVARFDAPFFNMTSDEAAAMDPQQRLLLEVSYEAWENAGIPLTHVMGSQTACFVGSFSADYTDMLLRDPEAVPMYQCTNAGQSRAMAANRVSYFFDLKGPSVTVDTACSGSLVALHLACQSLRTGDATTAMAAGVNLVLSHEFMSTMSMMKFLSPDGRCYTFDDRANGYARGEAIGCLILKPLKDALREHDTIRAIIRGSGSNQDGRTPGITLPNGAAQESLIRGVYHAAGLHPRETEFVEAHGTGTQAGDPIETSALSRVFGPDRPSHAPLRVGSIKTNVGHLEGTSGVAGVIKAILMLENRTFLPNRNFERLNPRIPVGEWNLKVQLDVEPWETPGPHRVSVNSFGYGGSNAHIILEDAHGYLSTRGLHGRCRHPSCRDDGPTALDRKADRVAWDCVDDVDANARDDTTNSTHDRADVDTSEASSNESRYRTRIFMLSGFDEQACQGQIETLREYLTGTEPIPDDRRMNDLAFTLNERRTKFLCKAAVTASSPSSLADALSNSVKPRKSAKKPTIGFVFTGQGAQWNGMGKELLDAYPVFRETVERIDAHLSRLGSPFQVKDLLTDENNPRLSHPLHSQPICSALQIALVDLLASWGIFPDSVTGHSSGEIAAAYAVGALSMEDAMTVAYQRGVAASTLQASGQVQGAMLAVGMSAGDAQPYVDMLRSGNAVVACINSPSSITISGDTEAIEELQMILDGQHVFHRRLAVEVAYHSHHMELVSEDYLASIAEIRPREGTEDITPAFFSSVTGTKVAVSELGPRYWVSNLLGQVHFAESLRQLCLETEHLRDHSGGSTLRRPRRPGASKKVNIDGLIEIGPHSALSAPIKQIVAADPKLSAAEIFYASVLTRHQNAVTTALNAAGTLATAGYALHFPAVNRPEDDDADTVQLLVDLPPYMWNHSKSYWAEPRLSKCFRTRTFPRTDLLGVPDHGSCPFEPRWRNFLRVSESPWLQDHRIQSNIVYPAAGYIVMAVEASLQHCGTDTKHVAAFQLRDISIRSALVVNETSAVEVLVTLQPSDPGHRDMAESMYRFRVYSVSDENQWTEHCTGWVGVQYAEDMDMDIDTADQMEAVAQSMVQAGLEDLADVDVDAFYQQLSSVGLEYGPCFANLCKVRSVDDVCLAEVSIPDTAATMPMNFQHPHVIHPCTLDSIFHAMFAPIVDHMTAAKESLVPVFIEEIYITHGMSAHPGRIMDVCARINNKHARDVVASIAVADRQDTQAVIAIHGLRCARLATDATTDPSDMHPIAYNFDWKVDPDLLAADDVGNVLSVHDGPVAQDANMKDDVDGSSILDLPHLAQSYRVACQYLDWISHKNPTVSILEIGAGSESASSRFLQQLSQDNGDMPRCRDYTVAVDSSALERAAPNVAQWSEWIRFQKLDVQGDLEAQAIERHRYDVVIVTHGLHMVDSLPIALANICQLLKPDGHLILIDPLRRQNVVDSVVAGSNPDSFERSRGSSRMEWEKALSEARFAGVEAFVECQDEASDRASSVITARPLRDATLLSSEVLVIAEGECGVCLDSLRELCAEAHVHVDVSDFAHAAPAGRLCIVLSELTASVLSQPTDETFHRVKEVLLHSAGTLWVVRGGTIQPTDPDASLIFGFARTARSEAGMNPIVTLDLDGRNQLPRERAARIICRLLRHRFVSDASADADTEYAERNGILLIPRLVADATVNAAVASLHDRHLVRDQTFHDPRRTLRATVTHPSSDSEIIRFVEEVRAANIPDGSVGIEVRAIGLGPKDATVAVGGLPSGDLLGSECSGVVYAVGDGVKDFAVGDRVACLGSGTVTNLYHDRASAFQKMPDQMPFELAATLPTAYCAAYYVVHHLVHLSPEDKVLIHGAAQPQGQALVELCNLVGSQVFATVHDATQRDFLSSRFDLSARQIFVGHDGTFARELRQMTHDKGVDVIIHTGGENDRHGRRLRTCLAPYGRLIQLHGHGSVPSGAWGRAGLANDAMVATFDWDHFATEKPAVLTRVWKEVMHLFCQHTLRGPSLDAAYPISTIGEALKAVDVGERVAPVVVTAGSDDVVQVAVPKQPQNLLRSDASYMLVGGLGGIGRATALWMADHGAKNLIFVNRSGLSTDASRATVDALDAKGVNAVVCPCDIADRGPFRDLMAHLSHTQPPVRGVIQAAMVLRDVHIEQMSRDDYDAVLRPKHEGTWNLHHHLPTEMDFFIMLSSISGVIGNATQAAYAAGSSFMDSFAAYRRSGGLPAVALDLGVVTDAGYLADNHELAEKMARHGFHGTDTRTVLSLVEVAIIESRRDDACAQIVTGLGAWTEDQSLAHFDAPLFAQFRRQFLRSTSPRPGGAADTVRHDLQSATTLDDAATVVYGALTGKIAAHLSVPLESIHAANPISEYGIDSHVAVELRNWIAKTVESTVPILDILSSGSLWDLSMKIAAKSRLVHVDP